MPISSSWTTPEQWNTNNHLNYILNDMTDEMKLKMMETLAKSGMSVGQFVMENNGTMTYNDHRGAEERKKDDACTPAAKEAIMEYVGRLRPVVREQYRDRYDEIWEGILEISQVKAVIYNKGKQQDTTFNRNLLAKIIHQVDILYIPTANSYLLASHLEPEKGSDHPVRQKLGEMPDKEIKNAVEDYIKENLG